MDRPKDFMRKYLGMERRSSMQAVCDPGYDIVCHVQGNIHGAHKPSMRTWNHMLFAASAPSARTGTPHAAAAAAVALLTERSCFRYAREHTP
jgi:hypothetical protein